MATGQVAPQKLMQLAADGEDTVLVQGTGPGHWSRAQRKNINEHRLIVRLIVYILLLLFLLLLYIAILIYVHLSPSLSLFLKSHQLQDPDIPPNIIKYLHKATGAT
jgi:hypothetical protein